MWKITKKFECDYGHRVHSQKLNKEYSVDNCLVCRHLHGHRMVVAITLVGHELDQSSMVTDFKHLNWFKKFIDDFIDHKFIIDINDPLFKTITGRESYKVKYYDPLTTPTSHRIGYLELTDDPILNEHLESFVVVDFVPTSEQLSKWFYRIASEKMGPLGVNVESVTFNETPKSESIYTGDKYATNK